MDSAIQEVIVVKTGHLIHLTQQIASSGEGSVWRTTHCGYLAKIYHYPCPERIQKLEVMIAHPPEDVLAHLGHISYAWPESILTDKQGQKIGFLMTEIREGRQLAEIYNSSLRKRLGIEADWRFLHATAYNIALLMEAIHKAGYVIGDVKPENILVNSQALPSFIDTDSFQVTGPDGRVYRCLVGSEGFTPPELIGKNFKDIDQTEVHDRFRLGVIIYTLLFGYEPFKGDWLGVGEAPELNEWVKNGYWPYGINGKVKPASYMIPLDVVHPDLKDLFLRCFNDGHSVPAMRPTPKEWLSALGRAISELQPCSVVSSHFYYRGSRSCYWCERRAKNLPDIFEFPTTVIKSSTSNALKSKNITNTSTGQAAGVNPAISPVPMVNYTTSTTVVNTPFSSSTSQGLRTYSWLPFLGIGLLSSLLSIIITILIFIYLKIPPNGNSNDNPNPSSKPTALVGEGRETPSQVQGPVPPSSPSVERNPTPLEEPPEEEGDFPRPFCGSLGPPEGKIWWPVKGPKEALDFVKNNYCEDAFIIRDTVQVASFDNKSDAERFASLLTRRVANQGLSYTFWVGEPSRR